MDNVRELVASCRRCKTFETLWFKGNVMAPTVRFRQNGDGKVYHNCGSGEPCQIIDMVYGGMQRLIP